MNRPVAVVGLAVLIAVPVSVGVYMAAFKSSGDPGASLAMAVGVGAFLALLVGAMALIGSVDEEIAAGVLPDGIAGAGEADSGRDDSPNEPESDGTEEETAEAER